MNPCPAQQVAVAKYRPQQRLGTPQDVADAAVFLASDRSSWIAGIVLDVAGGAILVWTIDTKGAPPTLASRSAAVPAPTAARGSISAVAAAVLGVLYAAVSAYWALGGTALLDTVGGVFQREAHSASMALTTVLWSVVGIKLLAAALGPLAVKGRTRTWRGPLRLVRPIAWITATVLTVYGAVLTVTGLLVQAGIVPAAPDADRVALRWHAYLWDPWFLAWGLLLTIALARSRPHTVPSRRMSLS